MPTIALVDDDRNILTSVSIALEAEGYRITTYTDGASALDGFKSTLNVQPVIPLALSHDWNLILRTILPIVHQEDVTGADRNETGLGDTLQSFFFSPSKPTAGGITWGVGPAFLYPTATNQFLGGKKWGAGPTFVGRAASAVGHVPNARALLWRSRTARSYSGNVPMSIHSASLR